MNGPSVDAQTAGGVDGGSAGPAAGSDGDLAGLDRDVRQLTEVVNRLRRALRASIRTEYTWESLPMAQVELLQCLAERNGARVGELAGLLRLAPNSVSTLVQHLSDAGYLHRERDPADRRAALLRLTPVGAAALAGWQRAHERRLGTALARLGEGDRTAILAALPALSNLVEALGDRGEPDR
ncbi:MarR family winged helix-turn-helix transcriptional regulator [Frankia sp. AgB32]|uniref:MarR family winged helix-turn-helix transcriptional regulator n=1 Tax=Frankia sp. AgB32 TaxID=631119 RepID=UPI00200EB376|nr:MarR family winged helix-turn-helix transcriptional regulator [Frankia sp. AgB32]MCK9893083.1 MarR family winged helix-turn-helix transcriptional regulator [Frankia sp. AgB32]